MNKDISKLNIKIHSPKVGNIRIQGVSDLSKYYQGTFSIDNKPLTIKNRSYLSGIAKKGLKSYPVAITLDRGKYIIDLGKMSNSKIYKVLTLDNGKLNVKKSINSQAETCATTSIHSPITTNNIETLTSINAKIINLSVDGDIAWYNTYTSESFNKIIDIIHSANSIYLKDLQININLIRTNIYTDQAFLGSQTADDPFERLENFRDFVLNKNNYNNIANTYFLFTTRNLTNYTAGIAYIGQICGSLPFGLVQDVNVISPVIFAHELGHNLSAKHDTQTSCSSGNTVMQPALGVPLAQGFSSCSITQINSFLNSNGQCLSSGDVEVPTTTPTPIPSATPQETPEESPEENPDLNFPELTIYFKQSNYKLNFNISNINEYAQSCSAKIKLIDNKTLENFTISSLTYLKNYNYSAIIPNRYLSKNKSYKLNIYLELTCEGVRYTSDQYIIDTKKSLSKTTIKKLSSWVTKFKKTVLRKLS